MRDNDSIGRFVGLGTLIVVILGLLIALAQCKAEQDRTSRENTPKIQLGYYVAKNLNLQDKELQELQLAPRIIPTRFLRTERSKGDSDTEEWYLFIAIVNRGPGRADKMQISIEWLPKDNTRAPDGLRDIEGDELDALDAGHFYALLVDTLSGSNPYKALETIHFMRLTVQVEYQDVLGRQYSPLVASMGNGPGIRLGPLYKPALGD